MEKSRSLDYGQMGTGPQKRECRAKHQILVCRVDPRAVTSEEVTALLLLLSLPWSLHRAGLLWLTLQAP